MIDTLKHAKSFEQAGFDKPQAEAIVGALAEMASVTREELATKADLQSAIHELRVTMKADLQTAVSDVRTEIQVGDAATRSEIAGLRGELTGDIAGLRGDLIGKIAESRNQTLLAMFGMQAALLGALIALGRFTELLK